MKYNKGIAPLVIVLVIAVVGGATYAVVQRNVLKSYFQTGDKPTEAQFADTIDSSLNLEDVADRSDSKTPVAPATPPSVSSGITEQKVYNPTKEYLVGDTAVKSETIYQAKVLSETETTFKLDKSEPITFRWTPIVPKPQEPTTYRFKVWQLMQGQNSTQAMKANQPIATKEVTDLTEVTLSGLYTGPCKPPYLCEFVWSVEVLASTGTKTETSSGATPTTQTVNTETSDGSGVSR